MHIKFAAVSAAVIAFALAAAASAAPADPYAGVDGQTLNRVADEGFNHSQIEPTIEHLSDQIGGRLTNSPAMRKAETWTQAQFTGWGLTNVHKEPFEFGRGWWIERSEVRMVSPRPIELRAIPLAWSPATNGAVTAPVIVAPLRTPADFAKWKGKLAGKIVLVSEPTPLKEATKPQFERLSEADIAKADSYEQLTYDPDAMKRGIERRAFMAKLDAFLADEGAVARATMSRSDGRIVHGEGSGYQVGKGFKVPAFEIGAEDYRRLARLSKTGEVTVSVDAQVHFDDSDTKAYDVIADIPGSDPKAGYVMAGAHLDSWVAGDGAADNGAGSAVVMEAARILSALHVKPRRTIRFALWAGEEQGLLGSWAYVNTHLAHRPVSDDPAARDMPAYFTSETYPITPLPGFSDLHGYFNIDNGSGKIRGVYAEGNFAAATIFKRWLEPFAPMGASAVVASHTGSTDHVFMQRLGLPAFQFIQDPLDYESRVHHTDLDTYDHLSLPDMRQAAVILAAMLLDAADSEAPLPNNVVPTQPAVTDPFKADEAMPR